MLSSFFKKIKIINEEKELTNKQRISIPFDVLKTHLIPQINSPEDVFNLRLTCKLFYNDKIILEYQTHVLKHTIKSLKNWPKIISEYKEALAQIKILKKGFKNLKKGFKDSIRI